jgi:hypothetical protein
MPYCKWIPIAALIFGGCLTTAAQTATLAVPLVAMPPMKRVPTIDGRIEEDEWRHAVAIKNVHFAKGTLMEYSNIFLSNGPWPGSYAARDRIHGPLVRALSRSCADAEASPTVATGNPVPVEVDVLEAAPQGTPATSVLQQDPSHHTGDERPVSPDGAAPLPVAR